MGDAATTRDQDQLRTLAVFHYILAGVIALGACVPAAYCGLGLAVFSSDAAGRSGTGGVRAVVLLLGLLGVVLVLLGALVPYLTGRYLGNHKHHTFCTVVAALEAILAFPLGTILGVFTIIVLQRDSVRLLFRARLADQMEYDQWRRGGRRTTG